MDSMCLNIINSNSPWYEKHCHFADALKDRGWIKGFLEKWGLPGELIENGYEFKPLDDLRSLLTEAADVCISGSVLPERLLQGLNLYLSKASMCYTVKAEDRKYVLSQTPKTIDWDYVMSEIALSFVRLASGTETARIKRCENPGCKSVFYDSSKNQARKWCCNTCSSLIKVRRHRSRQKA